jgi:hypothetical protein
MKIVNTAYRIEAPPKQHWLKTISTGLADQLEDHTYPLRFSIVDIRDREIVLEATTVTYDPDSKYADALGGIELLAPRRKAYQGSSFGVVQIVPTGIRCEVGGFAGDAGPATNLLAAAADVLVTHPNAVNASELNEMAENVLYVEGKALDDFLLGHVALLPVRSNRIGTFVDPTGLEYIDHVVNTLNAARAVKGVDCDLYTVLREELGVHIAWSETGCAVGTVVNPEPILEAVELFIERGVEAVGGVSVIHGVTKDMFVKHLQGKIPNPSGGVEAIITHLISKLFRIPTAHAPLPYYQDIKEHDTFNPRASAEFISTPHYFCVLKGLAKAPHLVPITALNNVAPHLISLNDIGAVVMPADALGGIPAFAAEFSDIPLIAVKENHTVLNITNGKMRMRNVIEVGSYLEAAGVVMALREGISITSLRRPISVAERIDRSPYPELVASSADGGVRRR